MSDKICMRASKFNPDHIFYPAYADAKLDGVRCIATVSNGKVTLVSRNNKPFLNYKNIEAELLQLPEGIYDGEITCGHFQELMRSVHRKTDGIEMAKDAVFNIFDIIDLYKPLVRRQEKLEDIFIAKQVYKYVNRHRGFTVSNEDEIMQAYEDCLSKGFEGLMVKNLNSRYQLKRSHDWMKVTPLQTEDVVIVGVKEGKGKNQGKLGGFLCEIHGISVQIGGGFTDVERVEYWQKQKDLIGKVIEVEFREKTLDGCFRFSNFLRFRPDKDES